MTGELVDRYIDDAFNFLDGNLAEVEKSFKEGNTRVCAIFSDLLEYSLRGNKYGLTDAIEYKANGKYSSGISVDVLSYLWKMPDVTRSLVDTSFSVDENGNPLDSSKEKITFNFLKKYAESAFSHPRTTAGAYSVLAYNHSVLPLCQRTQNILVDKHKILGPNTYNHLKMLRHLQLFLGNDEVISAFTHEFTEGPENTDHPLFYSSLSDFFPNNDCVLDYHDERNIDAFSQKKKRAKYLELGFTEEELGVAISLFRNPAGERVVRGILETYDLPFDELFDKWKKTDLGKSLQKHLLAIKSLEMKKKGSAKTLHESDGRISMFGRYDNGLLLEQIEPLEDDEKKRGS